MSTVWHNCSAQTALAGPYVCRNCSVQTALAGSYMCRNCSLQTAVAVPYVCRNCSVQTELAGTYVLPECVVFMFRINSTNWLLLVMETKRVYCEVGTGGYSEFKLQGLRSVPGQSTCY